MTIVSAADAQRIAATITEVEQKTSGEIIAMITAESSSYTYVAYMWAAFVSLALPWPFIAWTWWPVQTIYLLQLCAFAVFVLLFLWQPLRMRLVPKAVKHARAHRRAVEQFLAQNLHTTSGRTGVLIFVSVAEHYAEILADAGIHKLVPDSEWQSIVQKLTTEIAREQAAEGFIIAISEIGARLAQHFPPGTRDPNELPNHLIVLPTD